MDKDKLVSELLSRKAECNNTIDLNAYSNGLADMYLALFNVSIEESDLKEFQ